MTTYTYDNAGRLSTITDRKGNTLSYTYTPTGQIDTITYPDSSITHFTYDAIDRITQMQDSLGTTMYSYDDTNRTITVTDPNGFTVIQKYDSIGNLSEITYPNDKKVINSYDAANHLQTVANWLDQTATYTYDSAGRMISLQNFNGTGTSYGYDNAGRLTTLQALRSDSSPIATYTLIRDGTGNIIQTDQNEPGMIAMTLGYTAYTYNDRKNRLLTAGTTSYGFDLEGQLSSMNSDLYSFDYDHRLKTILNAHPEQFYYDGKGNRLMAVRNGVTTYYIYDMNGNVLAEADSNKNITKYYVYGNGLLLAMTDSTDQSYIYHFNSIGSTVAITDQNQNIVNSYSYDPYGTILSQSETIPQPFKYVGQHGVMREPNGFYYMRARYYDPNVGRFISEDPIGFDGGSINLFSYVDSVGKPLTETNLYLYTGNNPVNRKDPKGLNWHGNWCGPGGSGPTTDCNDSACKRHDKCYEDCGVNWLTRWVPGYDLPGSTCAWICDEKLVKEWKDCACSHGASGSWK